MRGSTCPEAWACRLPEKLPMPERVGSKVLPIPIKTRLFLRGRPEAMGEQQEPPRIYAGEVSASLQCQLLLQKRLQLTSINLRIGIPSLSMVNIRHAHICDNIRV